MVSATLIEKLEQLSPEEQKKIEANVDSLLAVYKNVFDGGKQDRGFGSMKGQIWTSDDFNEPLEDFKDYM